MGEHDHGDAVVTQHAVHLGEGLGHAVLVELLGFGLGAAVVDGLLHQLFVLGRDLGDEGFRVVVADDALVPGVEVVGQVGVGDAVVVGRVADHSVKLAGPLGRQAGGRTKADNGRLGHRSDGVFNGPPQSIDETFPTRGLTAEWIGFDVIPSHLDVMPAHRWSSLESGWLPPSSGRVVNAQFRQYTIQVQSNHPGVLLILAGQQVAHGADLLAEGDQGQCLPFVEHLAPLGDAVEPDADAARPLVGRRLVGHHRQHPLEAPEVVTLGLAAASFSCAFT